jgi:spore coat polysaccharide biosynthesis protein SpsF
MKIGIIVEARTLSKRLPGKVLLKVNKKTILEYLIERLKKIRKADSIIIATTKNKIDESIIKIAKKNNVKYFRGSENNVLDRVVKAATINSIDVIVRVTSDCPIIDVNIIDQAISIFLNNNCDFVSNGFVRSYPDGMDVEVFRTKTLVKSLMYVKNNQDKEHITLAIRKNSHIFKHLNLIAPMNQYWPELGLTLDEINDFKLIKKLINFFYKKNKFFSCLDIINILKKKKEWVLLNSRTKRTVYNYGAK